MIEKASKDKFEEYEALMLGALSSLGDLNIVQVGAHDGSIHDPLYDFVMKYDKYTEILLVEPQEELLPHLRENYKEHPNKTIFNGAVGSADELTLYKIKEGYWGLFKPEYAKDWPDYGAPLGVTSAGKEHVEGWIREHKPEKLEDVEEVIQTIRVPCLSLEELIERVDFSERVDVLQVDTESTDDEVIYNSSVEKYEPRIIHYESKHLDQNEQQDLIEYLADLGYSTFQREGTTIATCMPLD